MAIIKSKVPTDIKQNKDGFIVVPILGKKVKDIAIISREPVKSWSYLGKKVSRPKILRKALQEDPAYFVEVEEISGLKYFRVVMPLFESK